MYKAIVISEGNIENTNIKKSLAMKLLTPISFNKKKRKQTVQFYQDIYFNSRIQIKKNTE